MISRTYIKDIKAKIGQQVTLYGFVHALRAQSKVAFLVVRDITGLLQTVATSESPVFGKLEDISLESVVKVTGLVKAMEQAPGGVEIDLENIEIISASEPELPIPIVEKKGGKETDAPIRFDWRHLDLRKPEKTKIFMVWTELERGFRKFWNDNHYIQIYTPSFMQTPSESGAEVFKVDYFDRKAYLAQSPQFYKQMAMASGFEKVFIVGPVFRAEESFTTRHMTEFTGWDFEISYVEGISDVMDAEEGMLVEGFKAVKEKFHDVDIKIPTRPFPRLSMKEVKEILKKDGVSSQEEHDLSPEEERAIYEYVKKEMNHDFVFVHEWHKSKSAFYHMRLEEGSDYSRRADLLFKGLEITTLAQREHRSEILVRQAKEKNMNLESLADYMNFFKYGCPPHGGGGIGPARIIMKILDLPNVREATFLPRDVKRLNP